MAPRLKLLIAAGALVFVVAHVHALPESLGDFDSINFALGVEAFDVARHQPHPPGYPVFIALARVSTAVVRTVRPDWDRDHVAAAGLALLSAAAGTAGMLFLVLFWRAAGFTEAQATAAAFVAAVSPLYWLTASRPLSDMVGLASTMAVIAWLATVWTRWDPASRVPKAWFWAAAAAGLIVGVRTQSFWQTMPVLAVMEIDLLRRGRRREAGLLIVAAAVGCLCWFVPLVVTSGGLDAYLVALGSQGSDDFRGVEMLATSPSSRLLGQALERTFVEPWLEPVLAWVVLGLATLGVVRLVRQRSGAVRLVLLAFVPYLVFHLLFQETETVRYALPLVVPVAGLAVAGLASARPRATAAAVMVIVAASIVIAEPPLDRFAHEGVPVFRAFGDMRARLPTEAVEPTIAVHHQVWWVARRAFDWYRPVWDVGPQPFPGDREWISLVEAWRSGSTRPVWFLADQTRHDLAAFDPRTTTLVHRYDADPALRQLAGGRRLDSLDWWTIAPPAWMLGRGWALNPELSGMTAEDDVEPHRRPADAYLRRQSGLGRLLIGGRYLQGAEAPAARVTVTIDERPLEEWTVDAQTAWFARWIDVPDLSGGDGAYATLRVGVTSVDPAWSVPESGLVALEQFDAAPAGSLMFAYADDWHEREADPRTGLVWRWSSEASTLEVRDWGGDLTLTISGESPLRYFDAAPTVTVRAGDQELARLVLSDDFTETIRVPAGALVAAGGRLRLETDRTFAPAEREESADRRRLGLRLFRLELARR